MPKVFIAQVPSRYDTDAHVWSPTINIQPATEFGELVVMLKPGSFDVVIPEAVRAMKEQMRDYGEGDFVMAVGDPSLIAAATAIASRKAAGLIRLLKWDRRAGKYLLVEIKL